MTDIREAEQAVIAAARIYAKQQDDNINIVNEQWDALITALDALDKAMTPDPWELLDDLSRHGLLVTMTHDGTA